MGTVVPKPHALTEQGQLRRLAELGPAWIAQAFGGRPRVLALENLLAALVTQGVSVILITRGYAGVANLCLSEMGLLHFFEKICGNVGSAYGDETGFDKETNTKILPPDLEQFLGRWDDGNWDSKHQVAAGILQEKKTSGNDAIFIDDDLDEVSLLQHTMPAVHVDGNVGLSEAEVRRLMELLGADTESWALGCCQRWALLKGATASTPFAILDFNRNHLPIRVTRHIALLEADFEACKNSLRRVKMLLREPSLFCSITQKAFMRHMASSIDQPFSMKALQPVIQSMHAQLGLINSDVDSNVRFPKVESDASFQRQPSLSSDESGHELHFKGGAGNLYTEPVQKTDSRQPLQTLHSMMRMFQKTLLGLCPVTVGTAGLKHNVECCHEVEGTRTDTAVWARYSKLETLGVGHFGEVFRARELCTGRDVAVKQLERLSYMEDEYEEEQGEVSVQRALTHPNLLRIFEVVKSRDEIHIVTELAGGGTLGAYSRNHADSREKWIPGCMQQISSAVAYCHNLHVLHGDLKPENVLISGQRPDGSPLCIVCDFGHTTICIGYAATAAPGDPRYISPEVIAEEGLSPKSDIYMLGVTAYELLTGGWLPYFSEQSCTLRMSYYQLKVGGVREKILAEDGLDWRDLARLNSTDEQVKDIVLRMLARHAADRPSALELLQCAWLQSAHGPCKTAYDAMLRASASSGWGLWVPQHPAFASRLESRSKTSWASRKLLTLLGSGLDPPRVHGARLLFRRLDADGHGLLYENSFCLACETAGLSNRVAKSLFQAADLHNQGYVVFKNFVMICLDLESFTREELLSELASVTNRVRGPVAQSEAQAVPSFALSYLQSMLRKRPDVSMLRWVKEIKERLGPGDHEIHAQSLLQVLGEAMN